MCMLLTKEKQSRDKNRLKVDPNLCDLEPDLVGVGRAQVKLTMASFILYMRSGVHTCSRPPSAVNSKG